MSRWVRGDWQLLPWLMRIAKTRKGLTPNRFSTINRWKIFDNLRRSLLAPVYLALLVAGWLVLPGSPVIWTLLILLTPALQIASQALMNIEQNIGQLTVKKLFEPSRLPLMRWVLMFVFLPYEAMLSLSAIGVTLNRLFYVRKHMLQWTTAAKLARTIITTRTRIWWEMASSVVMSLLLATTISILNPTALPAATPLLLAWMISPLVADWISRPIVHISPNLSESQRKQLQRLARRTWAYFEEYAGPDEHWLPADHFQESPLGTVAHYTTPTNIGLLMLSTLSAYDLGYIGLPELDLRLSSTFENIDKLEHYRGHLLNWYDTSTLTALPPHYISTVDSGNFAACLISLKQGCLELTDAPIVDERLWEGLIVILDILKEVIKKLEESNQSLAIESFEVELEGL
jgi:cyclic beta-1,2-glucan synthetase